MRLASLLRERFGSGRREGPDWRRALNAGGLTALAQIFICLTGMPVALDARPVIETALSMGYVILALLPPIVGYGVGRVTVLEGMQARTPGTREVAGGAVAGAVANCGPALLILGVTHVDIRDPLVNWSPQLLHLLEFGINPVSGIALWVGIGMVTGAAGGCLHLIPSRWRRAVVTMLLAVPGVAVLESMLTDLSQGLHVEAITDWFYAPRRGLTIEGAAVVAAVAMAEVALAGPMGRSRLRRRDAVTPVGRGVGGRVSTNAAWMVVIAAMCIVLPIFLGKLTNELLVNVGLFVLLGLGLNIIVGLAGMLDLGYVAFFAVGGYTAAVLTSPLSPQFTPELHWGLALLIAMVFTGLTGLIIGAPVIRMRGDYLAVVTLGFGEIIRLLLLSDWLSGWFGGAQGITNIPGVNLGFTEIQGFEPRTVLYLVLFFCAITIYVSWRLERSRLGRAWMAVREDETVAEAMGIDTVGSKLLAFVIGGTLGAFSGAIFSAKVGSIFPSSFNITIATVILVVVIFGGMGNIAGVIAGAAVLIGVLGGPRQPGLLQEFAEYRILLYGALLVLMMQKRPEGLIPNVRRARELHGDELDQDAWLRAQQAAGEQEIPKGARP